MSDREKAEILLERAPDEKIVYLLCYMEGLTASHEDEPNDETLAAIEEVENGGGKVFSSVDDLWVDLED